MKDEFKKAPEWVTLLRQIVLESEKSEVSKNQTEENRLEEIQRQIRQLSDKYREETEADKLE